MKHREDFSFYGIDIGEPVDVVKKKVTEEGWTFPMLLDTRNAVALKYGINRHPQTFLIDKKGKIAAIAVGFRRWDEETAKNLINDLLSE